MENVLLEFKRWREIDTRYTKNTVSFLAAVPIRCVAIRAKIKQLHHPEQPLKYSIAHFIIHSF